MTWPTTDAITTNMDAGTDSPAAARPDILQAVQNCNSIKNHVTSFAQTLLDDTDAATARTTLGAETAASKDATGGYAGLTLFKINFKNAANTFTNFFTNATTAARTYTFQDRDGTIADNTDLAAKANLAAPVFTSTINTNGYTVAGLPTGVLGARAYVTDALTPTYLGTAVGGGAVKCPVFYDGTNWVTG